MRTDLTRYLIILFIVLLQASLDQFMFRASGEKTETVVPAAMVPGDAASPKLIKLVSPEENTSFRLKDPVKVVLNLSTRINCLIQYCISFDGKAVATLKSAPWEYTIPSAHTVTTGRKSLKVTAYRGGRSQNPGDPFYGCLFGYYPETVQI